MAVDVETVREIVRIEILRALREDPEVRRAVRLIAHSEFADTVETERRFDPALFAQKLGIEVHSDTEDVERSC